MGLIKSNDAPPTLTAFSMRDIESQAKSVLMRARTQADQLLQAAQAEADLMKKAARADGMAQGRREGLAQGTRDGAVAGKQEALTSHTQELKDVLAAMTAAAGALEASRCELEVAALEEVVQLSIAIARRVTHRQGMVDPAVLSANLEQALKLIVHVADIRIALHPLQETLLQELLPSLKAQWPKLGHVSIIADPGIAAGGCRVYAGHGLIDAELGTQLDRIVGELLPAPAIGSPTSQSAPEVIPGPPSQAAPL